MRTIKEYVLQVIKDNPLGLTCDDVEFLTGRLHQTVSARINELRSEGRIRETGRYANTRSGTPAIVWEAVQRG